MRKRLFALVALLLVGAAAWGAITDVWTASDGRGTTYWGVDSSGNLYPGTDITYNAGSSTKRIEGIYGNDPLGATVTASNLTLTSANVGVVLLNSITGDRTITLPTAASAGAGAHFRFIDTGGNISSSANVTLNVTSSGNINNAATFSINNATYEQADVYSDGSKWWATVSTKTN